MKKREHRSFGGQRDIYFLEVMLISLLSGAIIHGGLIGYFFLLGIPEMVYFNIFSVILFCVGFFVLRSHHKFSSLFFIVGSLEVVIHACLATYYLGTEAGFPLFLWAVPPLIILHSKISDWMALVGFIVLSILYVLLSEVIFNEKGVYSIKESIIKYSYYTCFFSVVSITMAIIFYYRRIVNKKEKIILMEIHHRIKNNLQIVSSIANIRNTEFSSKKTRSAVEELRMDVWYLSAMHNQIVVTGDGTLINFSRFMNEVMFGANSFESVLKSSPHKNDLYLNLETGIPLGLIASQIIEFYNRIQSKSLSTRSEFNIVENTSVNGEIEMILTGPNEIDVGETHIEESSAEIISLLLEQLNGSHELIREANSVKFRIRYTII